MILPNLVRNARIFQNQFPRLTLCDQNCACQRGYNCLQLLHYYLSAYSSCAGIGFRYPSRRYAGFRRPCGLENVLRSLPPASAGSPYSAMQAPPPNTLIVTELRFSRIVTQGTRCPVSDFLARSVSCPCQSRSSSFIIESICESPRHT